MAPPAPGRSRGPSRPPGITPPRAGPSRHGATCAEPGGNAAPGAYAVDWGPGPPAPPGTVPSQSSAIGATHTYGVAGTNLLRVTVTDKDGAAGAGSKVVTVSSVPAAATLGGAGNIARCDRSETQATAALLDAIPGPGFTLAHNARLSREPPNHTSR